jgi:hypothetical protein
MNGGSKERRNMVLLLHDFGDNTTGWYQLFSLGHHFAVSCDVDIIFLDFFNLRSELARLCVLLPTLLAGLVAEINARVVSIIAHGHSGTRIIEHSQLMGRHFACPHVIINPQKVGKGSDSAVNTSLLKYNQQKSSSRSRILLIFCNEGEGSDRDFGSQCVPDEKTKEKVFFKEVPSEDIQQKQMGASKCTRLQFSNTLTDTIVDFIMRESSPTLNVFENPIFSV